MMKFEFDNLSNETSQNNSTCIFIGLVLGLIIIFIKNLHTKSTMNTIVIVITMIFIIVGVVLLMSVGKWYEQIISVSIATALFIIAVLLDIKLQGSKMKWMIILFTLCCVFAVTGLIFFVFGVIYKIVVTCTKYYLDSYRKSRQFSTLYCVFLLMYEYIVLVISLIFSLNSVIDCNWNNKTMIRHDEQILFH
ncbi:hypothetical protein MS3_00008272 [Schistosoma haematobium]|uniref:Uncharacterized protein n=1 Tax=Schistosoma haematobium TaxID=6185 RepID=A0A922LF08_SCHHA|nr:hypothetical protein MS3_00008272 [Schistosoma haematobium]KAH9581006.1 hypothetical protein MS3_00008272 [Schistosoma haematobium]